MKYAQWIILDAMTVQNIESSTGEKFLNESQLEIIGQS